MCRSGAIDLICVDSVSALTPRAEIEVNNYFLISCTPGYNLRSAFFNYICSYKCTGGDWNATNWITSSSYEPSFA